MTVRVNSSMIKNKKKPTVFEAVPCPECGGTNPQEAGYCVHCNAIFTQKEWETNQLQELREEQRSTGRHLEKANLRKEYRVAWLWGFWSGLLFPLAWLIGFAMSCVEYRSTDKRIRNRGRGRLLGFVVGIAIAAFCAGVFWIGRGLAEMDSFSESQGERQPSHPPAIRSSHALQERRSAVESSGGVSFEENGKDAVLKTIDDLAIDAPAPKAKKIVFDEDRFLKLAKMKDKAKPTISPVRRIENVRLPEDNDGDDRQVDEVPAERKVEQRAVPRTPVSSKELKAAQRMYGYKKMLLGTAGAEVKRLKSLISTYERQVDSARTMQKRLRTGTSTYEADFQRLENGIQGTEQRVRQLESRLKIATGNNARLTKDVQAAKEKVDALRERLEKTK